jgi:hypothetical protein
MHAVTHESALPSFEGFAARWGYTVRTVDLAADGTGAPFTSWA